MTAINARQLRAATGFSLVQLEELRAILAAGAGCRRFVITRRNGSPRNIYRPVSEIDAMLKQLRMGIEMLSQYDPPSYVHGFVKGRGIVSNARCHLARRVVLRVDIRDYFESISRSAVRMALTRVGFDEQCAEVLSGCVVVDDLLPAGFSTSPLISNVVFDPTDRALSNVSTGQGMVYTRYADDLTFSADMIDDSILRHIVDTLSRHGWRVNESKTRFMRRGGPQFVTGLYVGSNDQPHIPRRIKRRLRQHLHYINKFGYESAVQRAPWMPRGYQLEGWIRYVKHVNPALGARLASQRWQDPDPSDSTPDSASWDDLLRELGVPEDF